VFSTAFDPITGQEWRKAAADMAAFSEKPGNQPGQLIEGLNITR